jgi:uncharacterized membrane protein
MDDALVWLSVASVAFVGSHFAMSHPLRPLLTRLGEKGFLLVYNLVSLATLIWMAQAFRRAPAADLPGSGTLGWTLSTILTLPALLLFLGSLTPRNPSFPSPMAAKAAQAQPAGAFLVTRHPMMWGFALWAVSHLILWWSWRTNIVACAILVLALLGSWLQDRKKERLMGEAWHGWETRTSFVPRLSAFAQVGWVLWALALVAWLVISWIHLPLGGVEAGVWRWL